MPGQFMTPAGGVSPALQEALQRRQGGGQQPATAAVGSGAPTFDPTTQPPAPPTAGVPGQPPVNPGISQGPKPTDNDTLIIKALSTKLNQKPTL